MVDPRPKVMVALESPLRSLMNLVLVCPILANQLDVKSRGASKLTLRKTFLRAAVLQGQGRRVEGFWCEVICLLFVHYHIANMFNLNEYLS